MTAAAFRLNAPRIEGEELACFGELVAAHGRTRPDHIALIDGDRHWTWAEFTDLVARLAGALAARGIGRGDMVASLSENSAPHVALYTAVLWSGACMVPLPFSASEAALQKMLENCRPRLLFASDTYAATAAALRAPMMVRLSELDAFIGDAAPAEPAQVGPDDLFDMIYSSGTTGAPKGIAHDHRFRTRQLNRMTEHGMDGDSVVLMSTPLYSNTTLVSTLNAQVKGATLVVMGKFDATKFLELSQTHRVTHSMLVPVQYMRLMDHPEFDSYDLSSYRCKTSTSAPLPGSLIQQIMDRWPGNLVEYYGMTEGGPTTSLDCGAFPEKWDTVGKANPGCTLHVIDEAGKQLPPGSYGEIVGRSITMMPGYYGDEEKTRELLWVDEAGDHYIRTGDMGRIDEDGFVHLLDRRKDMIISGGFNIFAADLEAVLRGHPDVADVAVIAIPSRDWGETPLGFVVPRDGSAPDPEALRQWANERLGKIQRLSAIELREDLPRSEIGKVLKRELRAPYWEKTPA